MSKKDKKKYLQDYRWFAARIEEIDRELSKPIDENVRFNGVKAEKDAVEHRSKQERLEEERERLNGKMQEIESVINSVTDSQQSILLRFMYISGKSAKEVAVDMNISLSTIYKIHDLAIKNVRIKDVRERQCENSAQQENEERA